MENRTPGEIATLLRNSGPDNLQLLDVREPWEYNIVHVKGSQLIPLSQLQNKLDKLDKNKPVVVICHHGIRSAHACYSLERAGFKTINVSGGIDLWARELDPEMELY